MTDAKDALTREPYPFVNARRMEKFVGSTVALVGKVERIEGTTLIVKSTDGKFLKIFNFGRERSRRDWLPSER